MRLELRQGPALKQDQTLALKQEHGFKFKPNGRAASAFNLATKEYTGGTPRKAVKEAFGNALKGYPFTLLSHRVGKESVSHVILLLNPDETDPDQVKTMPLGTVHKIK